MGAKLPGIEAGCTRDHLLASAGLIFLSAEGASGSRAPCPLAGAAPAHDRAHPSR